jgi:1-acyl-sn-glycerol-3-phosphate acyltransferase
MNPFWSLTVTGLENIDRARTYVIVSNHQSLADIIVMYQLKSQFKWVAKESLFKVPFVGWSLSLARHVRLYRGKFASIKKVYRQAAEWLRSGMSVLFFPEGTRSGTGEMGDFQNGAFKLAIKEGVPVLPVSLDGTGDAIPKGSWLFKTKVKCALRVYPAIETTRFEARDYENLKALVRAEMESSAMRSPGR